MIDRAWISHIAALLSLALSSDAPRTLTVWVFQEALFQSPAEGKPDRRLCAQRLERSVSEFRAESCSELCACKLVNAPLRARTAGDGR